MPPQQDGGELKRTESFQYPSGHVGQLNATQAAALEKFKEISKSKGYWKPETNTTPATHDDETLLRYLRARKFVPQDAFTQFKDTEDWRLENQLDKLYETIDIQEYDATRRLYPQWVGRRDKQGIPVYLFEVSHLDSKAIAAYQSDVESKHQAVKSKVPVKMMRLFALYENLCRFVLPLCSTIPSRPYPGTPISQSSNIVDISGVSIMQFWKLKSHMQDASLLATAHYPETLDRIFLIGAPSFFPTVWGWIKRWFDPITVSKIFVLNTSQTLPTLLKYIDIENIPKKYGGKLEFKFGDLPHLDSEISAQLQWTEPLKSGERRTLPTGPVRWQYGKDGKLVAVAVGSEKGVQRNRVIAGLHPDATIAQLSLSPGRIQHTATTAATPTSADPAPAPLSKTANGTAHPSVAAVGVDTHSTTTAQGPDSTTTTTSELPHRENMSGATAARDGTSDTRYEQQAHTHAHGQLEEGTPAIRRDGQGEKQAVMEPNTVGQAPKEHPVPEVEQPQPSIIDQAKQTAGQAYESAASASQNVLAAVGIGGKKEEAQPVVDEKKEDPAIDKLDGKNVEEFLRASNMSKPQA